jgi:hypothetical protein
VTGPIGQEPEGSPATGSGVRWVIELRRTEDDHIEGVLTREGADRGEPFCGWLDLLWRLEAAVPLMHTDPPAAG